MLQDIGLTNEQVPFLLLKVHHITRAGAPFSMWSNSKITFIVLITLCKQSAAFIIEIPQN